MQFNEMHKDRKMMILIIYVPLLVWILSSDCDCECDNPTQPIPFVDHAVEDHAQQPFVDHVQTFVQTFAQPFVEDHLQPFVQPFVDHLMEPFIYRVAVTEPVIIDEELVDQELVIDDEPMIDESIDDFDPLLDFVASNPRLFQQINTTSVQPNNTTSVQPENVSLNIKLNNEFSFYIHS